jgi:hypothetical protein
LAINFSLMSTRDAFRLAFGVVAASIKAGRPLRRDEVRYLARLIDHLASHDLLPFLSVVDGLELASVEALPDTSGDESLRSLGYSLKEAEFRAVQAWNATWNAAQAFTADRLFVEFIFDQKPNADLISILQELAYARGDATGAPELLGSRQGSYVETVALSLGTLMAFVISLGMLVRVVDSLISLRAKLEVLAAPRLPRQVRTRALQQLPSSSSEVMREITQCLALLSSGHLLSLTSASGELATRMRAINVRRDAPRHSRVSEPAGEARLGIGDQNGGD